MEVTESDDPNAGCSRHIAQRRQQSSLTKRRGELASMQDRLLNAYLAGSIDEPTFKAKGDDLKAQVAMIDESLA